MLYISHIYKEWLCDANLASLQVQAETLRFETPIMMRRLFLNLRSIIARSLIKIKK